MKLVFDEHFLDSTGGDEQVFNFCMAIRGEVFKSSTGRTVYRFIHRHYPYFIKIHTGVGAGEIFKNLSQGKAPVLGAGQEWAALHHLLGHGLLTLTPVGYGERGVNPAKRESFLITRELANTVSFEEITHSWAGERPDIHVKRLLIAALADVVARMHKSGLNHRDCYLCHFRLDMTGGFAALQSGKINIYIIDLHRAQIRQAVPKRWWIKDMAALYFSSLKIGLTKRDYYRFMKAYTGKSLREMIASDAVLWGDVKKTGDALFEKCENKRPVS